VPRGPRQKSETGIYHVMLKGIDGRNIFMQEGDRKKFLSQMLQAHEKGGFSILAYCLMNNHVHLLLEENEELGTIMKRITVGYALWHNHYYGRSGHLFQNRYLSEVVEKDEYLVTVARYIHQNPVKAGLVDKAVKYRWSSYQQYIDAYNGKAVQIHPDRIKVYFKTRADFEAFMNIQKDDKCLDYRNSSKVTDDQLAAKIKKDYQIRSVQKLAKEQRDQLIQDIYKNESTSIRQVARVLGVSKGVVEKAL